MKKRNTVVPTGGKEELSFSERELLKGAFSALRPSPKRVEEITQQIKKKVARSK